VPDYDVGITGLAQPPATAPVQTYYPAVAVANNGIHPAAVTGLLRIYDKATGELLETHDLASTADIPAGETRDIASTQHWAPTDADIGRQFLFIAHVTTWRDQYEPNNHLPPTTVTVAAAPPPPPPGVTPHATQHQEGGADTLNVDSLHGELADPQPPKAHKTSHESGGSDLLNVNGLPGILAEGQPIADHHKTHEAGGGDDLNVDDLHGVLYNKQKPQTHDNAAHDPNYSAKPHGNADHDPDMATKTEFDNHTGAATAHAAATNLEQTANKGAANGYCPLDGDAKVPSANLPPLDIANRTDILTVPVGPETEVVGFDFPAGTITTPSHLRFSMVAYLAAPNGPCTLTIRVGLSGPAGCTFTIPAPQDAQHRVIKLTSDHYIISQLGFHFEHSQAVLHHNIGGVQAFDILPANEASLFDPGEAHRASISVVLAGIGGAHVDVCGASIAPGLVTSA